MQNATTIAIVKEDRFYKFNIRFLFQEEVSSVFAKVGRILKIIGLKIKL